MTLSIEESNRELSPPDEFIWECKMNDDPWDATQTSQWIPYSNVKSSAIEQAYKNKLREIFIDENYRIDFENFIQQHINDPYRQRSVRRRRCHFSSIVSTDEETNEESVRRERLSSPLGSIMSCSATGDTTYYGSVFIHTWLLMFTKGKIEIRFDTIYPVLKEGLIKEGEIANRKNLPQIVAMLTKVEEKTHGKSSEKRIKELQKCCANLYTKPYFIYRVVNTALRDDDQSKLYTLGPYCYLLFNYIGRLKDNSSIPGRFRRFFRPNEIQSMTLYRGDRNSDSIVEEYRRAAGDNSKHFKWLPFVSTSRDRAIAEGFPGSVLYIIEMLSYSSNEDRFVDLSKIGHFPTEQEILLLPGVQFRVNKVEFDNEKGLHLVYINVNSSYIFKLK
jgi:hypothetical protein